MMLVKSIYGLFKYLKNRSLRASVLRCLSILLLVSGTAAAQTATRFEKPPILRASDLAPATLLSGNGFRVDDQVPTDGLTASFTIRSDVGTFQAHGLEMLRIRIAEIPAIVELENTSKTKVFAQSVATNAARPVVAAGQMVMHPVDTVKGLPSGVGRFFGRVGLGAQRLKETVTEPKEGSEVGERSLQTTRDIFGYEQERRELAKKLHVDPYTTNPVLSKQLDDIALAGHKQQPAAEKYGRKEPIFELSQAVAKHAHEPQKCNPCKRNQVQREPYRVPEIWIGEPNIRLLQIRWDRASGNSERHDHQQRKNHTRDGRSARREDLARRL
jgi:hypothetical protein